LFSDSVTKLKEQLEWVDDVLEIFNLIAEKVRFRKLSREEIRDSLNSAIDQKMSQITLLARAKMLVAFGDHEDLGENFNRFLATYSPPEGKNDEKRGTTVPNREGNPVQTLAANSAHI
jgi:hypothetical protein